ncbi:hypothetical protein L1049_001283 [Liquidambar formosana]|uniref:Uncharacterized protein n=1 Tax=Liquidambar formosana TaxID=63359 RepID=A0AAP0NAB6_LIQFO
MLCFMVVLGENFQLNIHKKNLRISRDWVGDQWVDIEWAKPDILSAISAAISLGTKLSTSSTVAKDPNFDGFAVSNQEVPTSIKLDIVEEEKPNLVALDSSHNLPKEMDCANDEKQQSLNEEGNEDDGACIKEIQDKDKVDDVCGNDDGDDGDDDDNDDKSNDDVCDDKKDGGKLHMEELEISRQKCEAVELMEVVA